MGQIFLSLLPCAKDQNYGNSDDYHLLHSSGTLRPHAAGALLCEVSVAGLIMMRDCKNIQWQHLYVVLLTIIIIAS